MSSNKNQSNVITYQTVSDQKFLLSAELEANNFNLIRFASYRTAQKLRFIQKKMSLHLIDIWNVIEAFRENGLNTMNSSNELSMSRLNILISSLFHSLNKRVPLNEQVHVEVCTNLLLNWLCNVYSNSIDSFGKIKVFSVKVALSTLCTGKLVDKYRYIFSHISDTNGYLISWKFSEYLKEALALPAAVFESPSFFYYDDLAVTIFDQNEKIGINEFLETMIENDVGPKILIWISLIHRISKTENVSHSSECSVCKKSNFFGFRYKCQKCTHYILCQDCFWKGLVTPPHLLEHQVKEYSTSKSSNKNLSETLRKSIRCVPDNVSQSGLPNFPNENEQKLNLAHIVPPSPLLSHNGFSNTFAKTPFDSSTIDSRCTLRSLDEVHDDEHYLIARYAAKLSEINCSEIDRLKLDSSVTNESTEAQKDLINQLETRNKEIMMQISKLKREKEGSNTKSPDLSELKALRIHKDDLESHLTSLQDSRRNLMSQLETLMKILKNNQISNSNSHIPQDQCDLNQIKNNNQNITQSENTIVKQSSSIIEPLPNINDFSITNDNLVNNGAMSPNSLRNDLLIAADSVTNAMSTLVKELNSNSDFDKT